MPILEVIDVNKLYLPDTHAVRDADIRLEQGEILCLLGPSGCGKTTLLRMIAGLEKPDSGAILFEARDIANVPPYQRGFGMMFQDFALFPHKNVRDNIAFGLRMKGVSPKEISEHVSRVLDVVELEGLADRTINQLSGGEQQRVALGRALAPGPRLLMLDEPLGALDRALRERLMLDLRAILKRVGMTAVYVTHDQTEAFSVGDRLAVMNAGRIVQTGPPREIYENPATPFVAQFLGFQNLVRGRIDATGMVETEIGRFQMKRPMSMPPREVMLLIKPVMSGVESRLPAAASTVNVIRGIVDSVIFRGRFSQIWIIAGPYRLLFEEAGNPPFVPGDEISASVSPDHLYVYEASL